MKKIEKIIAKRCKYEGCNRTIRTENKSGYCYNHFRKIYYRNHYKKRKSQNKEENRKC